MRRLALVLPFVLLAACGGGSASADKKAYLAKAEALCTKVNADIAALTSPSSTAAVVTYATSVVAIVEQATKDFDALTLPAKDRADLTKKVVTPLHKQLAEGRTYLASIKSAVAAHDNAALGTLLANPPKTSGADLAWMRAYGFKSCVKALDNG